MSWRPRSLYSRMVLVLLAGLTLAQAASLAIYWRDRDDFMQRAMGMRSVQRIGDIVRVLDTLSPGERSRLTGVLNSPQLRVSFEAGPIAASDAELQPHARLFSLALRRLIGDDRPLSIQVSEAPFLRGPPDHGPGMMNGGMMGAGAGRGTMGTAGPFGGLPLHGTSFVVQTRLADGALVTFDARQSDDDAARPYRLLLGLGVLLGTVIVLTLVAVRWATRPLDTLAIAAERLGQDIRRPPLDETGPTEVARAARAFNTMQRQLVRFIDDRTRIFAAMSHDLKTPITRLRLRAELLDDAQLKPKFEADLEQMQAMVTDTLELMRGLDRESERKPIDIVALLESLQDDLEVLGGEITVSAGTVRPYPGKPGALKRCLANLIENAVRYGSSAHVTVADSKDKLEIRIADRGPGIPEAELERVLEPFYRLDASRNRDTGGTGLGLAIARNIARSHGGELTLRNRAEGGLEALLTLPRQSAG